MAYSEATTEVEKGEPDEVIMELVEKLADSLNRDCRLCLIPRRACFLIETDDGRRTNVCEYHYGKLKGYINE